MGAFVVAWVAGQAIIVYRNIRDQHSPPWPGQMLAATGLYFILAMISEMGQGPRQLSIMTAWGLNIAALLNLGNITYLPGKQAGNDWWAQVKATQAQPGGTTWIFPTGGCGQSQSPNTNYGSPTGPGIPTPSGIPVNPATGKCPGSNYYEYNGKCYSSASDLPPGATSGNSGLV